MLRWLTALLASSFTFALADVLCDVCIAESEEETQAQRVETAADDDDVSDTSGIEMASVTSDDQSSPTSRRRYQADSMQQTPVEPRYKALDDDHAAGHGEAGLSGAQDAALAGAPLALSRCPAAACARASTSSHMAALPRHLTPGTATRRPRAQAS